MSSTTAAHALAQVLIDQAEALASDELVTISAAMSAVRAAARQLESSLSERGWGGDVLYGWGDGTDDQPHDEFEDDDIDESAGEDDPAIPPSTVRLTCQSRFDFYLIDETALMAHTLRRAGEVGLDWDEEWLSEEGPFAGFTYLHGLENIDLDGTGLARAGGQVAIHEISSTLWELHATDPEAADDAFPTSI